MHKGPSDVQRLVSYNEHDDRADQVRSRCCILSGRHHQQLYGYALSVTVRPSAQMLCIVAIADASQACSVTSRLLLRAVSLQHAQGRCRSLHKRGGMYAAHFSLKCCRSVFVCVQSKLRGMLVCCGLASSRLHLGPWLECLFSAAVQEHVILSFHIQGCLCQGPSVCGTGNSGAQLQSRGNLRIPS